MEIPTEVSKQLLPLNWVRGIAALMVVAFHCHITMAAPKYFGVSVFHFFAAGNSGVQLFFVLSGFVIFLAHHSDAQGSRAVLIMFAFKRFRRIYPPLWTVLLLTFPLLSLGLFGAPPSTWDIFLAYLILPAPKEILLAVEWTLRHEILFYAFFAIFLWQRSVGLILLLLWGIGGSVFALTPENRWPVGFLLNPNHMLFLFGMGVAWVYSRGERRGGISVLIGGIALFGATYALSLTTTLLYHLDVFLFGLGAAGIVFGLSTLQLDQPVRLLDEAGAASYSLYLIHFPIISAMLKIALIIDHNVKLPLELYFVAIVVVCQLTAIIFHHRIEKPTMALVNRFKPRGAIGKHTRKDFDSPYQ